MPVFFWAILVFGALILAIAFIFYCREILRPLSATDIKEKVPS